MIEIKRFFHTNCNPLDLASYAARICYDSRLPEWGHSLNVEKVLFKTGHHTTLEHFGLTFVIEGLAVGDATFGLHLFSPFYNSDQRSGRFSAKMFQKPEKILKEEIEDYLGYWPEIKVGQKKKIISYCLRGLKIFKENHQKVTELARKILSIERPFLSPESLEKTAAKVAQEQLRMFIPIVFPTALTYTIDLITLAALQRVAWAPELRDLAMQMISKVLEEFPELEFLFEWDMDKNKDWAPDLLSQRRKILTEPKLNLLKVQSYAKPNLSFNGKKEILDLLPFSPSSMDHNLIELVMELNVSLATFGQEQRHRTLHRGTPKFTGAFYLPPLLRKVGLGPTAKTILDNWLGFYGHLPKTLWALLAPYGAVVKYKEIGNLNAVLHQQSERLCWLAQEEIYNLGIQLRKALKIGGRGQLAKILAPPCFTGVCPEGKRYCGRDLSAEAKKQFFPKREV